MCTAFASSSTAPTPATASLGLVHSVYKPMPGRFKDYIAIPRVNGYQSLHTTLFGPNGVPIEVQIRSEHMHRVAESGIAAHWKYKSGGDTFGGVEHDRAREWLASLVQIQEGGSSEEFLESVKVDLFPDKVYVFTPKGKILRLPTGATAVDFAYAIHTDVGNRCVAAKVDRRLVPLRTPLRNGQTVEIITAKGATPNPSWSSFLVTAKARAAIRQYLKNLKRGEALELGRRLLGLALEEFSLSLKKIPAADVDAVVKELNLKDADELYEKIGLGERLAPLVARRLQPARDGSEASPASAGPLMIAGTEGLLVTYARCCFPIPYDPIMAYLSAGRGVMIHRQNCGNLAEYRKQPEKWLSVAWEGTQGRLFSSEIQLEINNRVGVLAAVASAHRGHRNEYRSSLARGARRDQLLSQIPAAGARPQAPRACYPYHSPHAGRAAGLSHAGLTSTESKCNADTSGALKSMAKQIISTANAPAAIGVYSQAARVGNTIWVSGQIPLDPATKELVSGDMESQVRQVFRNLQAIVEAAGAQLDDVVKATVYLIDLSHFALVNKIMAEYFREPYPARAAVGVAALPRGAQIEVECVVAL